MTQTTPKICGANLLYLRKKLGYTQTEMGNKCGGNLKQYQQWEYGYAFPPLLSLLTIERIFKIKPFDLVYKQIDKPIVNEDPAALFYDAYCKAEKQTKIIVNSLLQL